MGGMPADTLHAPEPSAEWSPLVRLSVAAVLFAGVLAFNDAAVDQSVAFIVGTHLPLLAGYVAFYRRASSSAVAAAGLLMVTIVVWLGIADSEAPDEVAFAWLTHAVLWAGVLVAVGALASILSRR